MAPPTLKAWLRTFLRHEVDKVIEWKKRTSQRSNSMNVKREPHNSGDIDDDDDEHVYEDDGSNFRGYVATLRTGRNLVQLVEVLFSIETTMASTTDKEIRLTRCKKILLKFAYLMGKQRSRHGSLRISWTLGNLRPAMCSIPTHEVTY